MLYDIFVQAVGTLLGTVAAVIGAYLVIRWKIRTLKGEVYFEIAVIYRDVESTANQSFLHYSCPIWDSVIASTMLLYIGDSHFSRSSRGIYSHIKMLQSLEQGEQKTGRSGPSRSVLAQRKNLIMLIGRQDYFKDIEGILVKLSKETL